MAAWVAPLISAGASLLGGLLGKKEEKQENTVDYVKMVKWAEKAGFNPLTALRAGGAAGFTTTTSHPALSAWTGVGDAIGQVAAAFDPQDNARAKLQDELMQAQLDNIQAETKQRMRSMEVPVKTGATAVDWAGRPIRSLASQVATGLGQVVKPEEGKATVTNPHNFLLVDPQQRDAEQSETRYGELGQMLFGAKNMIADIVYNVNKDIERQGGLYKVSPTPKARQKQIEESWHGGYLPSFSFSPGR